MKVIRQPHHGSIQEEGEDGILHYVPQKGHVGFDDFAYEVCAQGSCDTADVDIEIEPTIVAVDDYNTTTQVTYHYNLHSVYQPSTQGTHTDIHVLANDVGTPSIETLTVTEKPSHGTTQVNWLTEGVISYFPKPDFTGLDSFTYKVSDKDIITELLSSSFLLRRYVRRIEPTAALRWLPSWSTLLFPRYA